MGGEGHYYYLQSFAKAMAAYGDDIITTTSGEKRYWRRDLVKALLKLQKDAREWVNAVSGRWQESIPELVTCYAMTSLEVALGNH